MTKDEEYRRKAVEFAELARRAASTRDKARMFGLAEAWLDRAQQMGRRIRNIGERPWVKASRVTS